MATLKRNSIVSALSRIGIKAVKLIGNLVFARVAGSAVLGTYFLLLTVYRLLYQPANLGMGQIIIARVSRIESASDSERTVGQVLGTVLTIQLALVAICVAALVVFRTRVDGYVGLEYAWLLVAVMVVVELFHGDLWSIISGHRRIDVSMPISAVRRGLTVAVQVLAVLVGYEVWGLVGGFIVGQLVSLAIIVAIVRPSISLPADLESIQRIGREGTFSYLDSFLGGEKRTFDILILGLFVGQSLVGVYGIVYSIAMVAILVPSSIGQSLLPELGALESADSSTTRDALRRSLKYGTVTSIPLAFGAYVVGDDLLRYAFLFDTGGVSLTVLSVGAVSYSIYEMLHQTMYSKQKLVYAVFVSGTSTVANVAVAVALIPTWGILGAAVSTAISMAVAAVLTVFVARNWLGYPIVAPWTGWAIQVFAAAIMALSVAAITSRLQSNLATTVVAISAGALVYGALLWALDSQIRTHVRQSLETLPPVFAGDQSP